MAHYIENTMTSDFDLIPCVIFAYNRPDKLLRVLSALKVQHVDNLIIFIDGPSDDDNKVLPFRWPYC